MKRTIKFYLVIILMALLPWACDSSNSNETTTCGTDNPLVDLEWLQAKKHALELNMGIAGSQIIQYTYHSKTVFWIDECYNCPDNMISVYNCKGNVICQFGGIAGVNTCADFSTEATDSTMLFNNVQY